MADEHSLEARVAVLEQIARETIVTLGEIRQDIREIRREHARDFRWLIGLYIAGYASLLAVMAHGFKWI